MRLRTIRTAIGLAFTLLALLQLPVPGAAPQASQRESSKVYTCPMDREVRSATAGACPKCGMSLQEATGDSAPGTNGQTTGSSAATRPDGSIDGLSIPDVPVIDQDGRRLRFFNDVVKGRTVAINFMFTTCTTICPPLAATFARVQQQLGPSIGNEIMLISVSVDPVTDVPQRMKAYLSKFGAGPGWLFIGGSKLDVDVLLQSLGAYVSDKNDHTPMILVGNEKAGFWTRAFGLASANKLASIIAEVARKAEGKGVGKE
jgi:cytochrome oxidase Cu insertion factor (SCO1/SenC/PrrC family)